MLFEDTCYITFYNTKGSGQKMNLSISTPLDSAFMPDHSYRQVVYIGKTDTLIKTERKRIEEDSSSIDFVSSTLPGITVKTIRKKQVDLFNDDFSTGLFNNPNERIFDGLENNNIAQSSDIIEFLRGRIAGLRIIGPSSGSYTLQWQGPSSFRGGSNVDVFLDEVKIDRIVPGLINPSDVAMIKAIPPPAFLTTGGQRAAICIYSKKQTQNKSNGSEIRFKVFGYSP